MASIISQQLSTKVADVIYARFIGLFNGKEPKPHQVLETSIDTLRSVGLSNQKAGYIQNVANFFVEQKLTDAKLHKMDNEKVIQTLTQIKGVGQWTTEMLLMFTLGREDVFPADDLGIQQGMEMLYKISPENKKEMKAKMEKVAEKWKPYRTYACLHIWKWKDQMKKQNKPL
ncbi:MAG: DNA-3-methyladenine glycosylase 2 family protein [Bacteroidota bacterium]